MEMSKKFLAGFAVWWCIVAHAIASGALFVMLTLEPDIPAIFLPADTDFWLGNALLFGGLALMGWVLIKRHLEGVNQ